MDETVALHLLFIAGVGVALATVALLRWLTGG